MQHVQVKQANHPALSRLAPAQPVYRIVSCTYDDEHKYSIFLSHSPKEQGFAEDLSNALTSNGFPTFDVDIDEHQPTADLFFHLARNMQLHAGTIGASCRKLALVVLSDTYFSTRRCMLQLLALVDAKKKCLYDGEIIPLYFGISATDLRRQRNLRQWRKAWVNSSLPFLDCEDALHVLEESSTGLAYDAISEGQATFIKRSVQRCKTIYGSKSPFMEGEARLREIVSRKFKEMQESPHNYMQMDVSRAETRSQFKGVASPLTISSSLTNLAPAQIPGPRESETSTSRRTFQQHYEDLDAHSKPLYQLEPYLKINSIDLEDSIGLHQPKLSANHVDKLEGLVSMLRKRQSKKRI